MSPSPTVPSPTFPADVLAFAAEIGVTDYLIPVYEMTRRVFPMARRITPVMEYDPEIAGLRWIVFEVEIGGMTVDRYVDLHSQWVSELIRISPTPNPCCFGLHEDIKDE